jgi:hypothetical protein
MNFANAIVSSPPIGSQIRLIRGWTIIHKSDSRAACLEFVDKNWTDMRPNSLIKRMKQINRKKQTKRMKESGQS